MTYEGEKKCTRCGEIKFTSSDKSKSEFNHSGDALNADGSPRFQSNCKPCQKLRNKENTKTRVYNIFKIRSERFNICEICGLVGWRKMQFHHPNGEDKSANPSDIKSIKKWLYEVSKCIVLCASCHQELHFNERHPELEL